MSWIDLRTEIARECYDLTYRAEDVQSAWERYVAHDREKERGYDKDRYPDRKAYLLEWTRKHRARQKAAGIKRTK
jgi:hypothetical protein